MGKGVVGLGLWVVLVRFRGTGDSGIGLGEVVLLGLFSHNASG